MTRLSESRAVPGTPAGHRPHSHRSSSISSWHLIVLLVSVYIRVLCNVTLSHHLDFKCHHLSHLPPFPSPFVPGARKQAERGAHSYRVAPNCRTNQHAKSDHDHGHDHDHADLPAHLPLQTPGARRGRYMMGKPRMLRRAADPAGESIHFHHDGNGNVRRERLPCPPVPELPCH